MEEAAHRTPHPLMAQSVFNVVALRHDHPSGTRYAIDVSFDRAGFLIEVWEDPEPTSGIHSKQAPR